MGDDGAEHWPRTFLTRWCELGDQHTLLLVRTLALGDIDIDANDPLRAAVAIVRK